MPSPSHIGTMLSSDQARLCGLCGEWRTPNRSHVPPKTARNNGRVRRAPDLLDGNGVRRPGRWTDGGMWVRGHCYDCNHRAGRAYDQAYADFASQIDRLSTPAATRLQVFPDEAPGAYFAPGLVARCVLSGMFAINPRLRVLFPELASDLVSESTPGDGPIRWPDQLRLRVGRVHPVVRHRGLLTSGIWSMRVLAVRQIHFSFGDIVFWPLVWSLVPSHTDAERDGLGPQVTKHLPDASDWVHFSRDRTSVDLRLIIRKLPGWIHPAFSDRNDWVELMTSDQSDAHPVVVYGLLP